jgi:hypothetical protein
VARASGGRGRGQPKIQLMIQRVQDARGGESTVLWDSGAQVSLVTHEYAKEARFRRRPASIRITGVGAGSGGESSIQYKALLRRRDGSIGEITPYGVDKIMGNATSLNPGKAKALFPSAAGMLEFPAGPIQLLIGMDHMEEAPREEWIHCRREHDLPVRAPANPGESPELPHCAVQPPRVLTCRGYGDRGAPQVPCMPELQRMPVPHGQLNF